MSMRSRRLSLISASHEDRCSDPPATPEPGGKAASPPALSVLPDELILRVLYFLEVNDLLILSRTSWHLRILSHDPLLHKWRLQCGKQRVSDLLPRRPQLYTLQPPLSAIYLTRTHLAARKLHWSLVSIRLNKSLLRRPKLATLVSANIVPKECCKVDRSSGELVRAGLAGPLVERKRKVEREAIKDGLRVWLDRKARDIRAHHRKDGSVGILIWRFSRRMRLSDARRESSMVVECPAKENVSKLRRIWEGL